jgi:hypothetical protein
MLLVTLGPMAEFGLYKIAHLQSFRSEFQFGNDRHCGPCNKSRG